MQDALCDVLKGYKPASVVRIPNAGHLVSFPSLDVIFLIMNVI